MPFLGLSLLRNQTETLAIGNSLSLSQMSNPSCSPVNAIAQAKEIPVPILTQFPFSIFSNVFLACVARVSVRFRSKERGTRVTQANVFLAFVAWRFCQAGRMSGQAARKIKIQVARAPISSQFLCPRPSLLLSAPNQNRHATQANVFWNFKRALQRILGHCIPGFLDYY